MRRKLAGTWASGCACVLLGSLAAGPALAQSSSGAQGLLNDSWVINGGAFFFQTDIKARLNGQSQNNPEVDFDEDLGKADDAKRGRLDVLWRINPNHHLRFLYFDNSNTRNKVLTKDIQWEDYTFQLGANLETKTGMKVYELAYEYAFVRTPTYELAGSIGVHLMDISLSLSGTATVTGVSGSLPISRSVSSDLPAPLPVIGFRAGWAMAPQWYLDAQAQFFKIEVDGYDGRWTDARLGVTWMFSRNFGVGIGYNLFGTNVDVTRTGFNGDLKFGYSGAQVYLTGSF